MKKLYDLIHSLSQSEKHFVKIRLNANKSSSLLNSYFDYLGKQKKYSIEEIKKKGKQSEKLTQSNLSVLFTVILKHLQSHYMTKDIKNSLKGDLISVKILMDKGFFNEAKIHCKKIIQKANANEEFEILTSAYKVYWNLHLLNGELNTETNLQIQNQLNATYKKENDIVHLEEIYREVTTLYYSYFFNKRDASIPILIKKLTNNLVEIDILSDTAKHIYFEIKAIEYNVQGNITKLHEVRKKQFKKSVDSPIFKHEHLQRLMGFSNLLTKLKSERLINEFSAYLDFLEEFFLPVLNGNPGSVLMEKYYDIYFINQSFLNFWSTDKQTLSKLLKEFKTVLSKGYLSNPLLVGRIYLSLIEAQIIIENYSDNHEETSPLLVEFFIVSKKTKSSKLYLEADLLFLVEKLLQQRMDSFDNAIESLNRKIHRNKIELDQDQKTFLKLLNDIYNEQQQEPKFYIDRITNKQTYKLFIYKLLTKYSISTIKTKYFPSADPNYNPIDDEFLRSFGSISSTSSNKKG